MEDEKVCDHEFHPSKTETSKGWDGGCGTIETTKITEFVCLLCGKVFSPKYNVYFQYFHNAASRLADFKCVLGRSRVAFLGARVLGAFGYCPG